MDRDLSVGIWPGPLTPHMIELLAPAAAMDGGRIETGPAWATWVCHDGDELVGAAQVRRCVDRSVDVVLVGGRDCSGWIHELDAMIGRWATDEGCTHMTAQGRCGWVRVLTDWRVIERKGRWAAYRRDLT